MDVNDTQFKILALHTLHETGNALSMFVKDAHNALWLVTLFVFKKTLQSTFNRNGKLHKIL